MGTNCMFENRDKAFLGQGTEDSGSGGNPKRRYAKFVAAFVILIAAAWGGFFVYSRYLSPEAKRDAELQAKYEKAQKAMDTLEATLRADTYGGKTPEETLALFIDALKKGDADLASKYFALNTNMNSPDYLTRREWENALRQAKAEGRFGEIAGVLEKAVPTREQDASFKNVFWLSTYDKNSTETSEIELTLNKYSGVWKIESI